MRNKISLFAFLFHFTEEQEKKVGKDTRDDNSDEFVACTKSQIMFDLRVL